MKPHGAAAWAAYRDRYRSEPHAVSRAPGRVNLIGEHTDYMGGFVLPAAIDRDVVFVAGRRSDETIEGISLDFQEVGCSRLTNLERVHPCRWMRYVLGVVFHLQTLGYTCGGFQFAVKGDVPIGSGLSSSAALELATCTALQALFGFSLSPKDAAILCQQAENQFVGVHCGIMDQYISSIGRKDHAILIDCLDLSVREVTVRTPGFSWAVIDSGKRRGLSDSAYNTRRTECEQGLAAIMRAFPGRGIESLRDVRLTDLDELTRRLDPLQCARVRHVVTENERVLDTAVHLANGNIAAVGRNLLASHESLRHDFAVSCRELDQIVDILSKDDAVAGARLTGAGFGGCVIALVRTSDIDRLREKLLAEYRPAADGTPLAMWPVCLSDGAGLLSAPEPFTP